MEIIDDRNVVKMSSADYVQMKQQAELGRRYVDEIKQEIKRLARLTGQESLAGFFIDEVSDVTKLTEFRGELEKKWDALCPPRGHAQPAAVMFADNEEGNPIYDKLGVTAESVRKHRGR